MNLMSSGFKGGGGIMTEKNLTKRSENISAEHKKVGSAIIGWALGKKMPFFSTVMPNHKKHSRLP